MRAVSRSASRLSVRHFGAAAPTGSLRRTPLWELNKELGASTTEFGGWDMPLHYKAGIKKEHLHTREAAGLFDVSHMIPIKIWGKDRVAFMERVTPSDVAGLPQGQGTLSSLLNEQGGLIDDLIVTNAGDHLFVVVNAGHDNVDLPHMAAQIKGQDVTIEKLENRCLLALQGPAAATALKALAPDTDFSKFAFMTGRAIKVAGFNCFVTRSGYTGEDGFEIGVEGKDGRALATALFDEKKTGVPVLPIGLGARDSLRLEAGLCLYGNDLNPTTTLAEAGLTWTIGKRRKEKGGFIGAEVTLKQLADKTLVKRKRVGLITTGSAPRSHDKILDDKGNEIGEVTSGVYSPSLGKPVSMAYVKTEFSKKGTKVQVPLRGKPRAVEVTSMPFVPSRYFRMEGTK